MPNAVMIPLSQLQTDPEYNALFPPLKDDEFTDLCASIKDHGVLVPLHVDRTEVGYTVLAGRHRFIAAQKAGWIREVLCLVVANEDELITALFDNVNRRQLTPQQRTELKLRELAFRKQLASSLIPEVLALARSGAIDNETRLQLTHQSPIQQREYLQHYLQQLTALSAPVSDKTLEQLTQQLSDKDTLIVKLTKQVNDAKTGLKSIIRQRTLEKTDTQDIAYDRELQEQHNELINLSKRIQELTHETESLQDQIASERRRTLAADAEAKAAKMELQRVAKEFKERVDKLAGPDAVLNGLDCVHTMMGSLLDYAARIPSWTPGGIQAALPTLNRIIDQCTHFKTCITADVYNDPCSPQPTLSLVGKVQTPTRNKTQHTRNS